MVEVVSGVKYAGLRLSFIGEFGGSVIYCLQLCYQLRCITTYVC